MKKATMHPSGTLRKKHEMQEAQLQKKLQEDKEKYVQKILKIIYELEKQKIKREHHDFLQKREMKTREDQTTLMGIENHYKARISLLERQLREERRQRKEAELLQQRVNRQICHFKRGCLGILEAVLE